MQASFSHFRLLLGPLAAGALLFSGCSKTVTTVETVPDRNVQITAALAAADQQMAAGQIPAAITALEVLRAANPARPDVLEALAFARSHAGDRVEAAALFEQAAQADPERRSLLVYAASLDASAGDHVNAARVYQAYLKDFPKDAAAWKNLAQELQALGQSRPALDAYLEALKQTSDHQPTARVATDIGQLFLNLRDSVQAEAWFKNALLRQPDLATLVRAKIGLLQIAKLRNDAGSAGKLLAELDVIPEGHAALVAANLAPPPPPTAASPPAEKPPVAPTATAPAPANPAAASTASATVAVTAPGPALAPAPTPVTSSTPVAASAPVATPAPAAVAPTNVTADVPAPNPVAPSATSTPPATASPTPAEIGLAAAPESSPPINTVLAANAPEASPPSPTPALGRTGGVKPEPTASAAAATPAAMAPLPTAAPATPSPLDEAKRARAEGRSADAIRLYSKILGQEDTDPSVWLGLAQSYFDDHQFANAVNVMHEAMRRAPDDPSYVVVYLQMVKASQPPTVYGEELSAAYNQFPASGDIVLIVADSLRARGDNVNAARVLDNFLRSAPNDPRRAEAEAARAALPAK